MLAIIIVYFVGCLVNLTVMLVKGAIVAPIIFYSIISVLGITGCILGYRKISTLSSACLISSLVLSIPVIIWQHIGFCAPFFLTLRVWFSLMVDPAGGRPMLTIGIDFLPFSLLMALGWACHGLMNANMRDNLYQISIVLFIAMFSAFFGAQFYGFPGCIGFGFLGMLLSTMISGAVIGNRRRNRGS